MPLQVYFLSLVLTTSAVAQNNAYPAPYVDKYVQGCTGGYDSRVESLCKCIIRKAQQENVTYEQFEQFNKELDRTGQAPPLLRKLINACQKNPNS